MVAKPKKAPAASAAKKTKAATTTTTTKKTKTKNNCQLSLESGCGEKYIKKNKIPIVLKTHLQQIF